MTSSTGELKCGDVLDGRFRILELINRGGWNAVFKAIDTTTGLPAVVKAPLPNVERDPVGYARYLRELQIGGQLDHPGILKLMPIEESAKSRPYLVTEYLEGHSLHEEMKRAGLVPVADALKLGARICDALDYLHRRHIIHCDLTPGNIMLCADGSVRLIDFGIARFAATGPLTFGGFPAHVGTPEYMAPEQVKGKRGDARTDLYALGAVLYEMVTTRLPFDTEKEEDRLNARRVGDPVAPSRHARSLSPQVEEIILHALARRPADRYPSAAAMKADLEAPERVHLTGRAARLQTPVLARLWWPVAGLIALSLLVPVVLFFVFLAILEK